jgi:Bacterial regulatory proteins, luxR family
MMNGGIELGDLVARQPTPIVRDADKLFRRGVDALERNRFDEAGGLLRQAALQAEVAAQWGTSAAAKRLTIRESEILRYVAMGLRNAEVGQRLSITESTVKAISVHGACGLWGVLSVGLFADGTSFSCCVTVIHQENPYG